MRLLLQQTEDHLHRHSIFNYTIAPIHKKDALGRLFYYITFL